MADKNYDPSKVFVGTRLIRDEDENGIKVDSRGDWESGKLLVELFDIKTGTQIEGFSKDLTRRKYEAFVEDFSGLSTEEVIKEYFPKVQTSEASKTDLQVEAERSAKETKEREDANQKAEDQLLKDRTVEAEEVQVTPTSTDEDGNVVEGEPVVSAATPSNFENVRPVGDPDETPSNPEQKFSAQEMLDKGANSVGSGEKDVQNPEQSAPNVPEDEFTTKKGKTEKPSATTKVERDVTPVGDDAKTNEEVKEAETPVLTKTADKKSK